MFHAPDAFKQALWAKVRIAGNRVLPHESRC